MASSDERRVGEGGGGGEKKERRQIILANWGDRLLAWIVDFILVSIALAVLFASIAIPIWFFQYSMYNLDTFDAGRFSMMATSIDVLPSENS